MLYVLENVSSIFWLLNADLHEARVIAALEYLSSMTASLEPLGRSTYGQTDDLENVSLIQHNFGKGKFNVRFKRRNGRVKVMVLPLSVFLCLSLLFLYEAFLIICGTKLIDIL